MLSFLREGDTKLKDMLYSNYNVLTLPIAAEGKYKIGDTYKAVSSNWKEQKFNGLTIKNIDYMYGIRLHFDWNKWDMNVPSVGK